MTTRSGRKYRKEEMAQEETTGGVGVAEMMRLFLEDRKRREEELAEERRRREEELTHERRRREEEVQQQMQLLREMVEGSRRREEAPARASGENDRVKLSKLSEADDVEAYLTTFERMMAVYEVDRARWAFKLAPQLTGKAQQAYAAMSVEDAGDYDKVKTAILKRYNINEETYRQRFRGVAKSGEESHRELLAKLQDLARKWVKGCDSVEQVVDLMVTEQLLNTLAPDVRVWVRERKPKSSEEASQLADDYVQARRQIREDKKPHVQLPMAKGGEKQMASMGPRRCHHCGKPGHLAWECRSRGTRPVAGTANSRGDQPRQERPRYEVTCFNCGQKGHVSTRCPSNALFCGAQGRRPQEQGVRRHGVVEGRYVGDILLDTGCSRTLVRKDLVPDKKMREGDVVTIRCAHGDTVLYPLAEVQMEVSGRRIQVEAAVSDTLPMSVLLGTDVAELSELLGSETLKGPQQKDEALVVMTRAQAKKQEIVEATQHRKELESGGQAKPVVEVDSDGEDAGQEPMPTEVSGEVQTPSQDQSEGLAIYDFDDDIFVASREKRKLTRTQKRVERRQHAQGPEAVAEDGQLGRHTLELTSEELAEMQRADKTLVAVREAAEGTPSTAGGGFFKRDDLIYRRWTPPGHNTEEMAVEQLVLPQECRRTVLHIAHTIPLAGHLGKDKTAHRILQRFYWPTLYRDVAELCRTCEDCQKTAYCKTQRAPLIPLPIMEEPFQRIAMDIVGPLPRSRSGKRYILVVCDYATRYPEAVPLRSIDAEHVAEELVVLFSRVGVPKEILTDQGSNFTSQLLKEIYRLLHVHPIRTTPYHPQTDGLVERFNKTLKSMLRKTAVEEGKDWDKVIPYLLFAYREVPQASTGFSPFELLYGRSVRGPLDVLKEAWSVGERSDESVVSHVIAMREKMSMMVDLVKENMTQAQGRQKHWYDQKARHREFQEGDQVLVLLPTSANKLLARWQGPYEVRKRVGRVNYQIEMHDRRKRRRIFHVNMLRKFNTPEVVGYSEEVADIEDEGISVWDGQPDGEPEKPSVGEQLSAEQRADLDQLLTDFQDVMRNTPGRTDRAEHRIETGGARPVRLPPYRLPHAYRDTVKQELDEMLKQGIIEPSSSEWSAPIVLVKKKDGSLRLCVDYRRLNEVSETDAYPMPRIDDLIDRLGKAGYISTLDLTRGYWQVPMAQQARAKTAFATPYGLFQFNVMPFGLQGAPATFQRLMDSVVRGLEFTAAYLDDLIVYSETWEEHLAHLRVVFQRLREAGLTAKPKKCQFGANRCVYLGHVVGDGTVRPDPRKMEAMESFPTPQTKKQVRVFLGLAGYYRRFIPNYASMAAPLTDLTRKSLPTKIQWSDDCEQAFQHLKTQLCSAPVLHSPDFDKPFLLQTDASDRGIGAVLSQEDADGNDHPVGYFSRKFLPREQRYSTVEKECLAIKLGAQAFRVYLLGRPFTIQTDHRALIWLDRLKENNARLTRWSLALQPYQFKVTYRAGKANANADALSRATVN